MKSIFIGSFYLNSYIEKNADKQFLGFANDLLQKSYLQGLAKSEKVEDVLAITLPNVVAYPKSNSEFFHAKSSEKIYGVECVSLSFYNPLLVKRYCRYKSLCSLFNDYASFLKNTDVIFIYDLDLSLLAFARTVKKHYPQIKVVNIVPDLMGFTGQKQNFINTVFTKISRDIADAYLKSIDCFIYLTESMNTYMQMNKPYVVVEGIYNVAEEGDGFQPQMKDDAIKRILYAGAMSKRNGVDTLLAAFKLIKDNNYELLLCGDGELREEIETMAIFDKRVRFLGNLPHGKVLEYQQQSSLLINPRPALEEFTKYSFPSKTMEYFASGVPVLMYKLPGIPDEYYQYCYSLEETSSAYMADRIQSIMNMPFEKRKGKALQARDFILKNKTPKVWIDRIINFLEQNK